MVTLYQQLVLIINSLGGTITAIYDTVPASVSHTWHESKGYMCEFVHKLYV